MGIPLIPGLQKGRIASRICAVICFHVFDPDRFSWARRPRDGNVLIGVTASSTCTTGGDANKDVAISRPSGPAEPIGVKDMETNNSADAAGDSTLLQTWNQRYPHLAKNKNRKQRRQRFDGPAGNMVRNFLAKRNADPRPTSTSAEDKYQQQPKVGTNTSRDEGVGSSEEEKEQKIDLCELEQNENASTDQGGKSEKDLSIEDDSFGTDALYKEVASAVFGGELSNR